MLKPLVLVVEDEAALATMLRYNLEKQGFRVEEAADGPEALSRIAETAPDLVLLDWMLPAMSGLEVCRQIRRRRGTLIPVARAGGVTSVVVVPRSGALAGQSAFAVIPVPSNSAAIERVKPTTPCLLAQ